MLVVFCSVPLISCSDKYLNDDVYYRSFDITPVNYSPDTARPPWVQNLIKCQIEGGPLVVVLVNLVGYHV